MPNETRTDEYTEPYDYRQYDRIWRRVNPQENPYPEIRARTGDLPPKEAQCETAKPEALNAILREELRHARELLKLLENTLA